MSTWNLACPDWVDRLKSGRPLVPDLPHLDLVAGERAVRVLNKLRLADVPGTPTMGEAGGEWFTAIVRALFGSVDPVTRQRMIRELFLLVPKKNNKTTGGALLMLTALLLNERPRAQFIMTAPVQDTANQAFAAAAGAIQLDPVLEKKLHVREHLKTIIHRETKAELEILTFGPDVMTGRKVSGGVLVDELHVLAKTRTAASSFRQLRGGMQPYPEAFMVNITTQSEDSPSGVFKDELVKARAIRDGKRHGATLPVLYEFPPDMQKDSEAWRDPENWAMVNPNVGRSVFIDRLKQDYDEAEAKGEGELREWGSQHLNIEIGLALVSDAWAGAEFWERQGDAALTLDALIERSEVVVVGIDGGGLKDLYGLAVIGRERETGKWLCWFHAWAHRIVLDRNKALAQNLLDIAECGELTIIDRMGDDVEQAAAVVRRIADADLLPEKNAVGIDPAGIGETLKALEDVGVRQGVGGVAGQVIGIQQGWRLNGAIKTAERKLLGASMIHGGQKLMAVAVAAAKVEPRGNAILITKQASGAGKIDPLMAGLNAVQLMSLNPEARGRIGDWLKDPVMVA